MGFEIIGVRVENLRGYSSTYLPLDRSVSVIVGPNNAGKTSVFRLLNWLLNSIQAEECSPTCQLTSVVSAFVLPARETKHRARRLSIDVRVLDGRKHRKFHCKKGIATLRLNVRLVPDPTFYIAIGDARRGEQGISDDAAIDLLKDLQLSTDFIYVPSFRDVSSEQFKETAQSAFLNRISAKVLHHQQGGAPREYRDVKRSFERITSILNGLVGPMWPEVQAHLPAGLARRASVTLSCEMDELIDFLAKRFTVRVSTGEHDSSLVPLYELGSGLQSLLDVAISHSEAQRSEKSTLLIVEEPESFLHPSAQRVMTRSLLSRNGVDKLVVTTHSATVVDESSFDQIVICKDHNFYFSKISEQQQREEINSAFLTGQGAEMLFASCVLLVEGESDRLFFEWIRRRIAKLDSSGRMDQLFVVSVGGKKAFCPWLRILEAYGSPADRPIRWCVLADGDAASEVRRAFQDAQITIPQTVLERISDVNSSRSSGLETWSKSIRSLNRATLSSSTSFALAPVDLESVALSEASDKTLGLLYKTIGGNGPTREDLLNKLGSKAYNPVADPNKAPWVRGYIGKTLPGSELSGDVRGFFLRWMGSIFSNSEASGLLDRFRDNDD